MPVSSPLMNRTEAVPVAAQTAPRPAMTRGGGAAAFPVRRAFQPGPIALSDPCVKYIHLCKFYTYRERTCIKNIRRAICPDSCDTSKTLLDYSRLAVLPDFGTRIAIRKASRTEHRARKKKKNNLNALDGKESIMVSSRFILSALLAAALTGGALVTDSMARSRDNSFDDSYSCEGCPGGYGPGYGWNRNAALSPEQQDKYTKIVSEYAKRMDPIQDQIFIKRQELRALQNSTNPDVKAVRETATELTKLNNQLGDLHDEMARRIEKEVGEPAGEARSGGYGPGYHMRGHGMGYGHGMGRY